MAVAARPTPAGLFDQPPEDRLYELRGELGLRFARLGWAIRAEVAEGPEGWVLECSPTGPLEHEPPSARIRISLTSGSISSQATRAVERVAAAGWGAPRPLSGAGSRSLGMSGYWCVPE